MGVAVLIDVFYYSVTKSVPLYSEHEATQKGRKRLRNPDIWKKKHVKKPGLRKNAPCAAISSLPECCKKECLKKFPESHLTKLRTEFEQLYYEQQNIYLNGLLRRHETKKTSGHKRKTNPTLTSNGKRLGRPPAEESTFSFEYYVRNERGIDVKVCQKAFCALHGFSPKRLQVLRRKIKAAGETSIELDKRGKHSNRQRIGEDVCELIRGHIRSFPTRGSHYSREDNSGRTYLSPELSIARLHRDFLEKHDPEYLRLEEENRQRKISHQPLQKLRKPIASEHFYHDIFVREFNIHFGYPRTDTCGTCDSLKLNIEASTDVSEKNRLEQELESHQTFAKSGYETFRYDQKLSKQSWKAIQTQPSSD